jgi:hypothetical protein
VFNLRQKGIINEFDFQSVYYLGIHFLDSHENAMYGKNRILRDLLDAWCEKRMTYAGVKYNDSDFKLSEQELSAIPGAECIKSVDALKLEVTVRTGTAVEIHPDQAKQWRAQGGNYTAEFEKLVAHHDQHYKNMLSGVIQTGGDGGGAAATSTDKQVIPVTDEADSSQTAAAAAAPVQEFESMDSLKATDELNSKLFQRLQVLSCGVARATAPTLLPPREIVPSLQTP